MIRRAFSTFLLAATLLSTAAFAATPIAKQTVIRDQGTQADQEIFRIVYRLRRAGIEYTTGWLTLDQTGLPLASIRIEQIGSSRCDLQLTNDIHYQAEADGPVYTSDYNSATGEMTVDTNMITRIRIDFMQTTYNNVDCGFAIYAGESANAPNEDIDYATIKTRAERFKANVMALKDMIQAREDSEQLTGYLNNIDAAVMILIQDAEDTVTVGHIHETFATVEDSYLVFKRNFVVTEEEAELSAAFAEFKMNYQLLRNQF